MRDIIIDNSTAKIFGRTKLYGNVLWCGLSGTGCEFKFSGKKLIVKFTADDRAVEENEKGYVRFAICVDGKRIVEQMCDEKEKTFTVCDNEVSTDCVVTVRKLSECAMSTIGISICADDDAVLTPTAEKAHKLEFIGDSITCGYGADGKNEFEPFSTNTEDVTKGYAYKTAEKVGADYSMFSASGYGVISGWCDDGENKVTNELIPPIYTSYGQSDGSFDLKDKPQTLSWDFSRYVPELCIVNLGTNDDSYCLGKADREEDYRKNYTEFLKVVRKNNPQAKILCILGIMGDRLFPQIEKAVKMYSEETSDTNISTFKCTVQQGERDGFGCDWHPSVKTHNMASDELAGVIKNLMGW